MSPKQDVPPEIGLAEAARAQEAREAAYWGSPCVST